MVNQALISVGADPELLLSDARSGQFIPACGMFGGTKEAPLTCDNVQYHEDNVTLELGWPAATTRIGFIRYVRQARGIVDTLIERHCPPWVVPSRSPCALFPSLDEYPQASVFGCDPDYDAYAQGSPARSFSAKKLRKPDGDWRFAGGHIHIGYDKEAGVPEHVAAMLADVFLTLPILFLDVQGMRRRTYGTPGRFRPKPYGVEYRTLSSLWFFNDTMLENVSYNAFALAEVLSDQEETAQALQAAPWESIRLAIQNEDATAANMLLTSLTNNERGEHTAFNKIRRI